MGKIYKNQTELTIRLDTGVDLSAAATSKIKYKKPSGATGEWTATVYDVTNGIIQKILSLTTDLDQAGAWTFWAYITFTDGYSAPGEPSILDVFEEGS